MAWIAIDARTGETARTLADGSLSFDRTTLYAPEQISGATQTLTAAMVSGGGDVYHVSAGGATPTLTMPTAAAIITAINASFPSFNIGMSYKLTVVNTNSGTATIATGTGITTSGTLTLATNTSRTFIVTYSAAGALTMTSLETGTTS